VSTAGILLSPLFLAQDGGSKEGDLDAAAERDARLVKAALADPDEYRHLVALYQTRVYATALRLLGNEADARDVSQEAFLRAFRALRRFQLGRRFGPWICTIAANAARDLYRDPVRRFLRFGLTREEGEATERASDGVEHGERAALLQKHLMRLSPKLREAIVLRYVSELSVEETAEALGVGVSAAKMRLTRALAQLEELAAKDP
jgi:RNA polymerase sigma-70 factor (ECF subfamily)